MKHLFIQFKRYALYEREISHKTTKAILRSIERLYESLLEENIKNYNTDSIREYLLTQKEKRLWTGKTFRNERQYLKTFFSWCVREGYFKDNPVDKIEKPRLPKRLPRFITKDQSLTILAHAEYYNWRYRFERCRNVAIIATFLMTGLRLNELINLRVSDVDFVSKEVFVKEGKGRKERIVPMHPRLQSILTNYNLDRQHLSKQSHWFFHSARSAQRMTPKTIQTICAKVSRESGIKFTPHMLRHTMARLSLDSGLGIYQVKELLGHSSITSTEIYSSVSKEGLKHSFFSKQLF
ncbi:tyrosine-type recombinase/integrase [Roseivirga pacifica]|uniref:tyrosine-type recombinase/integrase n=1 Tax=Roseivirga pacifica TaxID=1267423 RepID=UPI003BAA1EC0